jgi:uncharacterized protein (TIGR04255 family)
MSSKLVSLKLPEVEDKPLNNAPLTLVVAQVRHERLLEAGDLSEHRQQVMTLVAGPGAGAAESSEGPSGWQLVTPDATCTTVIQQEYFSIETSAYTKWSDFRTQLEALAGAIVAELNPKIEQRIGLRYIDSIAHPSVRTAADWAGLIDPALLGAVGNGPLAKSVRAAQQILELEGSGGIRVNLRHGSQVAASGGKPVYLLDLDCYLQAGRRFNAEVLLNTYDELHTLALKLFHSCLTPDLLKELGQ